MALIPILSEARGVSIVLRKWMRKHRLPDAIVIEHPGFAGGHLGATQLADVHDPRFDFEPVLEGIFKVFAISGIERESIPLIAAGGIHTHERVRELLAAGAAAVQMGTPFAVTSEGDAHPEFKRVLAEAKPEDIVTFMSVAGLPARAVARRGCATTSTARRRCARTPRPTRAAACRAWDASPSAGCATASPPPDSSASPRGWATPCAAT